jgi:hypothetical protein
MISGIELLWESKSLADWEATQNRPEPESDPDSNLTDLVPAISRLIAWLCEPETCERRGMRITAMVEVVRPDLNHGKSLAQLSPTSKQNLSKLCVDFRQTFGWQPSSHQIARRGI